MCFRIVLLFMGFAFLLNVAHAGENYDISGNVIFSDEGDIYICLLAKDDWQVFHTKGYELSKLQCKHLKMTSALIKNGNLPFKFKGVPKGTYSIVAYQDVNGNGKVDIEGYHISEPWESYKERDLTDMQTWDMVKFDLDREIQGLEIQVWRFSGL